MQLKKFPLLIIGVCIASLSFADTETLKNYLLGAQFGQMTFSQEVINLEGDAAIASGSLTYQRPAKFRLQYSQPNEVAIISNGETIWVYDNELEQVIISSLAQEQNARGFLAVLATDNIDDNFIISSFNDDNNEEWLILSAKSPEAVNFNYAHLNFQSDGLLHSVLINDLLGNNILASFIHQVNPNINIDDFEFVIPDGTEIIQQ